MMIQDSVTETYIDMVKRDVELQEMFDEVLSEEHNLGENRTGIKYPIKVSSKMARDGKDSVHGPRVKVSNVPGKMDRDDCFLVTVNKKETKGNQKIPASHRKVIDRWIDQNREHLQKVWDDGDEMDVDDVLGGFKKVDE